MTDTEQKARRERFEKVARQYMGKFPTLYDLEQPFKFGPDGDEYLEEPIQFAWEMWREASQAERREGMLEAAKIIHHFAVDQLTPIEYPPHGVVCAGARADAGKSEAMGLAIENAIREAAGRIQTTPHKEKP